MPAFKDAQGQTQQINLDVSMYRQAADNNMSLQQFINTQYPTDSEKYGSTFHQILASEGIVVQPNKEFGIASSKLVDILDGRPRMDAGVITKDAVPASRILFPAVVMEAIENKLVANLSMTSNALDSMIALDESINGDRYEYPVLNFSNPEAARSAGIAQLAMPASMMTLTASDVSRKIPTFSLGLEISDQAMKSTSLDFLALSLARQAAVERNERAQGYMLALLNGDVDNGDASLSSLGRSATAASYDGTLSAGQLSQKAWAKYLINNATRRTVTHVVTNIDTALVLEGRTGRPTVQTDNPNSPRIDTTFTVSNPLWPTNVNLFLTVDANWPANTIMGLDKSWAIKRVRSLSAQYQAVESFVLRRSTAMRFDFGETVSRFQDQAFDVLTLT